MRMKSILGFLSDSESKVYWIRDDQNRHVAVYARISERSDTVKDGLVSLAEKAERLAAQKAAATGLQPVSKGVFVGGNGKGRVIATGIAEIPLTPDIESRLSGVMQLV